MESFKGIFEEYGVDYEGTRERFMDSAQMYLKLLGMLLKDENLEILGGALEDGDLNRAFEAAHTLKGVAQNMGIRPLFEAVQKIVEPLRGGQQRGDYGELYENIKNEFGKLNEFEEELKKAI
ncbi:MAG: Hpt domain-containing protein [Oscillospiraceae bacterium]|nr:Hpt domain-containing protein [Oscillospiraceae bacterium]